MKDYTPPPSPKKKKKKKSFGSLPATRSGYANTTMVFAHLLILEYPDHHQTLSSSSLYYPGPLHKLSSQSIHNFLSNVVHRQTNRQTNATKNITSFAKEVTTTAAATTTTTTTTFVYSDPIPLLRSYFDRFLDKTMLNILSSKHHQNLYKLSHKCANG